MDQIEQLLAQLEEIVSTAKKSMFSSNDVIVNRNQVLELITRIRTSYPEVVKEAQYVMQECEKARQEALDYGRKIVDEAEVRSRKLVDDSEVLLKAQEESEQIRAEAYSMRERVEYDVKVKVDQLLQESEMTLRDALLLIRNNREELRGSLKKNNI